MLSTDRWQDVVTGETHPCAHTSVHSNEVATTFLIKVRLQIGRKGLQDDMAEATSYLSSSRARRVDLATARPSLLLVFQPVGRRRA